MMTWEEAFNEQNTLRHFTDAATSTRYAELEAIMNDIHLDDNGETRRIAEGMIDDGIIEINWISGDSFEFNWKTNGEAEYEICHSGDWESIDSALDQLFERCPWTMYAKFVENN